MAFFAYRLNGDALRDVQRAYLTIECQPDKGKDLMAYRVMVRNLGNTPALETVVHAVGCKYYKAERTKVMDTLGPKEARVLVRVDLASDIFDSQNVAFRGQV